MPPTASTATSRRSYPCVEELEPRQLLSGYQPTAVEQLFLERLNDARANPAAYGNAIGLNLSNVAPSQPLAFSTNLIQAARDHAADMNNRGYFAHNTPEGVTPGQRITNAGFPWQSWGESIAGGTAYPGPEDALKGLIIDAGVPNLGHRKHLLAIDTIFQSQNQVGIGVVQNGGGPLGNYYVVDSGNTADTGPFITGVVYQDVNNSGRYDVGEGLGGVSITISGVGTVGTFTSGGYGVQVQPGTYTVTASGPGLAAPVSQTVTVGGANVRLNFTPQTPSTAQPVQADHKFIQKLYQSALGRTAGPGELSYWANVILSSGRTAVANGIERSTEARLRIVDGWYESFLGRGSTGGEQQYWTYVLGTGASEEAVLTMILGSSEYYNRASTLASTGSADANFIATLFQQLLHRQVSSGEISYFTQYALPAAGTQGVVWSILVAPEFRANVVKADYEKLLQREASAGEAAYWVATGADMTTIRVAIEGSDEYYMKA